MLWCGLAEGLVTIKLQKRACSSPCFWRMGRWRFSVQWSRGSRLWVIAPTTTGWLGTRNLRLSDRRLFSSERRLGSTQKSPGIWQLKEKRYITHLTLNLQRMEKAGKKMEMEKSCFLYCGLKNNDNSFSVSEGCFLLFFSCRWLLPLCFSTLFLLVLSVAVGVVFILEESSPRFRALGSSAAEWRGQEFLRQKVSRCKTDCPWLALFTHQSGPPFSSVLLPARKRIDNVSFAFFLFCFWSVRL